MNTPQVDNELYFVVLPQIVVSGNNFGKTEQVLTLLPDRNFASEFFPDEVDTYIQVFKNRESYLVGGHVTGYMIEKLETQHGRVLVRVMQNVQR